VRVAVVGGGIVGIFAAWFLAQEGAEVTVFERGPLGAGSVHAAGIIEPGTAYRTNTIAFLRRVYRFWRSGTCTFRRADARWLVESARQLERAPAGSSESVLREISDTSVATYAALARAANDFEYSEGGLVERFDDRTHFEEESGVALAQRATVPVEVRAANGHAGELRFPTVSWLHTEKFVARMAKELSDVAVEQRTVERVELDGTVRADGAIRQYDSVAVCAGVGCRKLGVPLTGVRGYGWRGRVRSPPEQALIYVDRGIAVVPFPDEVKVTGGWDFDLSESGFHVPTVLDAAREAAGLETISDFKQGSRPCTPDGLPTVGRSGRLVVATGGFRLGWSFAPGLGRRAASLCLGRAENDPFLARYCGALRSADL
jgi:D-proline dehydrogenase